MAGEIVHQILNHFEQNQSLCRLKVTYLSDAKEILIIVVFGYETYHLSLYIHLASTHLAV